MTKAFCFRVRTFILIATVLSLLAVVSASFQTARVAGAADVIRANAFADFSLTQGENGWFYHSVSLDGTKREPLISNHENGYYKEGADGLNITKRLDLLPDEIQLHPARYYGAEIVYRVPRNDTVDISGTVRREDIGFTLGISFTVYHNNVQIFPLTGVFKIEADKEVKAYAAEDIAVVAGDEIRFVVQHNNHGMSDPPEDSYYGQATLLKACITFSDHEDPSTTDFVTTSAYQDFTRVNGGNGWYFHSIGITDGLQEELYAGNTDTYGKAGVDGAWIGKRDNGEIGMHPARYYGVEMSFKIPQDGIADISGEIRRVNDDFQTGVNFTIFNNETQIYPLADALMLYDTDPFRYAVAQVAVKQDDIIRFVIHHNNNDAIDPPEDSYFGTETRVKAQISFVRNEVPDVKEIVLNANKFSATYGANDIALQPIVLPSSAVDQRVTYESGNESVATVSESGVVKILAAGSTDIVVTSVSNPTVKVLVSLNVSKQAVEKPMLTEDGYIYSEAAVTVSLDTANAAYSLEGDVTATNAGNYTARVVLTDAVNYEWSDGMIENVLLDWSIAKAVVIKPMLTEDGYTYSKAAVTVSLDTANAAYTLEGDVTATNAGDYTARVVLTDAVNYKWSDGTTEDVLLDWRIAKAVVTKPMLTEDEYTYSKAAVTVSLDTANAAYTLEGDVTATNAGDYTAKVVLTDAVNYKWLDGTTEDVLLDWSIAKAQTTVTVSAPIAKSIESARITVNPVAAPDGRTVEYAISETSVPPVDDKEWQTSLTFEKLKAETVYYLFVRVKGDSNRHAGQAVSAEILTKKPTKQGCRGNVSPVSAMLPVVGLFVVAFILIVAFRKQKNRL